MLVSRLHNPNSEEILYHYCSSETLLAILTGEKIRFTDANLLNDAFEGRWGYRVFEQAADRILKREGIPEAVPRVEKAFFDKVDEIITGRTSVHHSFLACFSTEWDSLPQWRAYANDGRGFAVGIAASALKALPVSLLKVEYDPKEQVTEMMAALLATYMSYQEKGEFAQDFTTDCALIGAWAFGFKNPSFVSEQEIRCLHVADFIRIGENVKLKSVVDPDQFGPDEGPLIQYQSRGGCITPYLDMPLSWGNSQSPIREIVMGPRCPNALGNVFLMLGSFDLDHVVVRQSTSSYC